MIHSDGSVFVLEPGLLDFKCSTLGDFLFTKNTLTSLIEEFALFFQNEVSHYYEDKHYTQNCI